MHLLYTLKYPSGNPCRKAKGPHYRANLDLCMAAQKCEPHGTHKDVAFFQNGETPV